MELSVPLSPKKFRVYALCVGIVSVLTSVALGAFHTFAVGVGAVIGVGGFTIEYAKRYFPGGYCSTVLAAGGVVLVVLDWQRGIGNGDLSFYIQYSGTVLICWGVLMFLFPPRPGASV